MCIPHDIENIHSVFFLLLQNFYYFYSKIVDTGAGYAIGAGKVIRSSGKVGITSLCVVGDLTRLRSVIHSVSPSPFFGITYRFAFIDFPKFSYIICQRIVGIRRAQERLYRQQDCPDLKSGTPFILENIQANPAQSTDK